MHAATLRNREKRMLCTRKMCCHTRCQLYYTAVGSNTSCLRIHCLCSNLLLCFCVASLSPLLFLSSFRTLFTFNCAQSLILFLVMSYTFVCAFFHLAPLPRVFYFVHFHFYFNDFFLDFAIKNFLRPFYRNFH